MKHPQTATPDLPIIRVLISDDHPFMREGLAAVIGYKPEMTVVGQACNGHEAVGLFRQHQPDVTLMDLRMPELSGVEAIALICTEFPTRGSLF